MTEINNDDLLEAIEFLKKEGRPFKYTWSEYYSIAKRSHQEGREWARFTLEEIEKCKNGGKVGEKDGVEYYIIPMFDDTNPNRMIDLHPKNKT